MGNEEITEDSVKKAMLDERMESIKKIWKRLNIKSS